MKVKISIKKTKKVLTARPQSPKRRSPIRKPIAKPKRSIFTFKPKLVSK